MATKHTRGRNRRLLTYLWVAALAIVTIVLIYKEQTAILYILATLRRDCNSLRSRPGRPF